MITRAFRRGIRARLNIAIAERPNWSARIAAIAASLAMLATALHVPSAPAAAQSIQPGANAPMVAAPRRVGTPQTSFSVLHSFVLSDGAFPYASLIADSSGALYGTTRQGGTSTNVCDGGCGTVFMLTPPASPGEAWTQTVLYSFASNSNGFDGQYPEAALTMDASGALYGTTFGGGNNGFGTVFKLTPPASLGGDWSETVLHSFTGPGAGGDGSGLTAGVVFDAEGALYSTTASGGTQNCNTIVGTSCGTVFKLTPPTTPGGDWTLTTLYAFAGGQDGSGPFGGVVFDASGALYGTTSGIGTVSKSTVFKLTPPASPGGAWTESVLYRFCSRSSCRDGSESEAGLIFDASGALYGTTYRGGAPKGNGGSVFKLTPPASPGGDWSEAVLYSFCDLLTCTTGAAPVAGVILDASGALYGVTTEGGLSDDGVVFKLSPPPFKAGDWTETVLHNLSGLGAACLPCGGVISGPSGSLYGVTVQGGGSSQCAGGCGTVFAFSPGAALAADGADASGIGGSGTAASSVGVNAPSAPGQPTFQSAPSESYVRWRRVGPDE